VLLVDTDMCDVKIDGIYVLKAHDRLFIKRVRQRLDGSYEISSDNPTHRTVDTLNGDHQVEVKGRVVWCWNGRKL
jgi:phage repressor protein C with HTH and peptisase S24 domain